MLLKKQTMYIMDLKTVKTVNLKYINTVNNHDWEILSRELLRLT